MRFVLFYHSLVSDWNHGNAHFLRGVVSELLARGHEVDVYEPRDGWSRENLERDHGAEAVVAFRQAYPQLQSRFYDPQTLDLDLALEGADHVIVHEWNDHDLVRRIGEHRARARSYRLLFHDTHHRSVTDPKSIGAYDLSHYDGVLAFGEMIRELYLEQGWAAQAWTWHEAADTRIFFPHYTQEKEGDLIWIGNWGDEERTGELHEYLLEPVRQLKLRASAYGVRYPRAGLEALRDAGMAYLGWLPNFEAPRVFGRYRVTVHIPRRPYREQLAGIPTIRVFEALACGIPLVSLHWNDSERLFTPGQDYLVARSGSEMQKHLRDVLQDPDLAESLRTQGLRTILRKHTCGHRVMQLLEICKSLGQPEAVARAGATRSIAASAPSISPSN